MYVPFIGVAWCCIASLSSRGCRSFLALLYKLSGVAVATGGGCISSMLIRLHNQLSPKTASHHLTRDLLP